MIDTDTLIEVWPPADPVCSVTVVTDPPSGPYSIGFIVNFTCLIHPQLPEEGVTYRWRDYVLYTSPVVANSSLPYATLTIGRGHPHTAKYYCQVYYRNQLLASGNTVITVQCRLYQLWYQNMLLQIILVHLYCVQVCCLQLGQLLSRHCHLASQYPSNCKIHQELPMSTHMVPQWSWELSLDPTSMIITITTVPFHSVVTTRHSL